MEGRGTPERWSRELYKLLLASEAPSLDQVTVSFEASRGVGKTVSGNPAGRTRRRVGRTLVVTVDGVSYVLYDSSPTVVDGPGEGRDGELFDCLAGLFPEAADWAVEESESAGSSSTALEIKALFVKQALVYLRGLGLLNLQIRAGWTPSPSQAVAYAFAALPAGPPGRRVAASPHRPRGPRISHALLSLACEVAAA